MTDIAGRFIIALILAITGLMGILILSAVASNLTLQTPQGMAIAESAGDSGTSGRPLHRGSSEGIWRPMSFDDALRDADELLTRVALIPAGIVVAIMVIGGTLIPDFPVMYFFDLGIRLIANAMVPMVGMIFLIGALLWVHRKLGGDL